MPSTSIYTPEAEWTKLDNFPGEADVKVLRERQPGVGETLLVRVHPGGKVTPHAHVATVQHYVLEGEYESQGQIYGAGTYRLLLGHENVAEISTQNGVTILTVYDPIVTAA